ncbi:ribosomal subunit interface protein [Candidatus Falkowbacteria bacterium CG10_big_fil_rev_8_21_14_0_10_43_11]|uniref:Ribosomal subunit interface protein n=1 Tax=Candidatus Falkowbacteria bacterium CG10_big_fil_rev_8_21_14_0_10_43_11 TaxID=1974568 RepID=A0A2M6WLE9_9BACT|nr:MAG: ribosomal subunit interface protein [Candidatus Falkowbacteria bacterium CG10_big_fil_rev_8_21_14_0_10_43_11]
MNIQIKSENLTLTPEIKAYAKEKVNALEKYLSDTQVIDCKVKLALVTNHHQKGDICECKLVLSLPKETLVVMKAEKDIFKAIDKVKDHMARSIEKYKEMR